MKPLKKPSKPISSAALSKLPPIKESKNIDTSDEALQQARLKLLSLSQREEARHARITALIDLAQIYWKRVEYPAAIAIWKQLIALTQVDKDPYPLALAHVMLGNVYAHSGDSASALQNAKRAMVYLPTDPNIVYGLVYAYDFVGDEEQMLKWLRRLLDQHPDFHRAHEQMGRIYEKHAQFDLAIQSFRRALEIEPTSETALNELGNLLVFLERFDEARGYYNKAQEYHPDRSVSYNNMGYSYYRQGKLDEAKMWMERRLKISPIDAISASIVLGTLARRHEGEQALAESNAHYQRGIEIFKSKRSHLMGNRMIEHDACGALLLTGLGDEEARATWQFILDSPDTQHVTPLPWSDWLYNLRILVKSPHATPLITEVIEMLTTYQAQHPPTKVPGS